RPPCVDRRGVDPVDHVRRFLRRRSVDGDALGRAVAARPARVFRYAGGDLEYLRVRAGAREVLQLFGLERFAAGRVPLDRYLVGLRVHFYCFDRERDGGNGDLGSVGHGESLRSDRIPTRERRADHVVTRSDSLEEKAAIGPGYCGLPRGLAVRYEL